MGPLVGPLTARLRGMQPPVAKPADGRPRSSDGSLSGRENRPASMHATMATTANEGPLGAAFRPRQQPLTAATLPLAQPLQWSRQVPGDAGTQTEISTAGQLTARYYARVAR